jgi:hypothetical protein
MRKIALALFTIALINNTEARVFWNKFEVTAGSDNTVTLNWNVTEYNNKSFIVQHSINGADWEDISIIPSKNSAETMTDYTFTHINKLNGKQFYRLKDFDIDTKSITTSPIRSLVLSNRQTLLVWPNPATNYIAIQNDNSGSYTQASIYDLTGKLLIRQNLSPNINQVTVSALSAGIYLVRIENELGLAQTQKIVKQ